MVYDGGRQGPTSKQTSGVWFTYAEAPWGPWLNPQLVFNAARDSASGTFMRSWNRATQTGSGPAGPTIGNQASNDPDTTNGGLYAPCILQPFMSVSGDTLALDYTVCTWNPYTIVRMRSKFLVQFGPLAVGSPGRGSSALTLRTEPNPFGAESRLHFVLPAAGRVELDVFDMGGRRVRRLARGWLAAGEHAPKWNGRDDRGAAAPSGVYFVRLRAGGSAVTRRLVRIAD
jgi:hypothetical protein